MSGIFDLESFLELLSVDVEPLLGPIPQFVDGVQLSGFDQGDDQGAELNPGLE
jgi:hypothetical protein